MKERKKNTGWQNDTEKLKRRDQVAVTVGSHTVTKKRHLGPRLPVLQHKTHTSLEHILWQCKKTEKERRKSNMTKEVWKKGAQGAKLLVEYVKNIGLYYGLSTPRPK
jgi:hypothetical protein